jgi:hypothetical protein
MPTRRHYHLWLLLAWLRAHTRDPRCWECDEVATGTRVYFQQWGPARSVPGCDDHRTDLILAA